jgi:hypothetical protein
MLTCSRLACNFVGSRDEDATEDLLASCRVLPGVPEDAGVSTARRMGSVKTAADAKAVLDDLAPLLASARGRKDRPTIARYVLNSAALRFVAKDYEAAQRDYAEAETAATALGDERLMAAAQAGIASVFLAKRDYHAALAWARNAADRVERLARGLSDAEGASARANWRDVYVIGAVAAAAVGEIDREYWFNEAGRAGALEALGARDVSVASRCRKALARADAAREAESRAAGTVTG